MTSPSYIVGGVDLPRPFRIRRFGHLGFFQNDLAAARSFYVDQLGLRLTDLLEFMPDAPPAGLFMSYGTDHHSLVCIDARLSNNADEGYDPAITVNQISFQVGSLEEVVHGHRYFKERGIPIWRVGRDFPGSNWAFYCRDPDGYLVELFYGMEQIGWDRRSKPESMREVLGEVPSLPQPSEAQELMAAEGNGPPISGGFRQVEAKPHTFDVGGVLLPRPFKINRVGPVHLFVRDVATSEAFYTEHFGLLRTEEATWDGHRAVYLRHGTDHHTLALFPLAVRERLGFSPETTLMSLGIELCSYQQLKDAARHLREQGLPPGPDIPHALLPGIDHHVSFRDPAGHNLLLYFSMEQVGWDGRPRPASERRKTTGDWPETLSAQSDTFLTQTLQGPLA